MADVEHHGVTFLPVLLFLLLSCSPDHLVRAQTGDQQFSNSSYARFSPTVAVIVVIMMATFFFLVFFSIYIRHCSGASLGSAAGRVLSLRSRRSTEGAPRGLNPSVIETFPTFTYSEVKEHKLGKGALECAVCLNEFEEDETLRFIPRCDHVFHPECIDAWLLSHVTCPVCRANLVPAQPADDNHDEPVVVEVVQESSTYGDTTHSEPNNSRISDEIVIEVNDVNTNQPQLVSRTPWNQKSPRSWSLRRLRSFGFGKFGIDSVGHGNDNDNDDDIMVVVQPGENLERFTLRLPEQVRKEMMLRRSKSYIGTSSLARSRSGAGGRSSRRTNARRSDRWASLKRALSMPTTRSSTKVVADNGEGGIQQQ